MKLRYTMGQEWYKKPQVFTPKTKVKKLTLSQFLTEEIKADLHEKS